MDRPPHAPMFRLGPVLLLALLAGLGVWPRTAAANPCKADGEACRTNQSCCGGVCVNSAPPGKRPRGTCCTPTTCAAEGANCGLINDGTCPDMLNCGTCTDPETCGGSGTPNVCGTSTTTTTTTTTSSTIGGNCRTCWLSVSDLCTATPCTSDTDCQVEPNLFCRPDRCQVACP
jgi:hypothetical protein